MQRAFMEDIEENIKKGQGQTLEKMNLDGMKDRNDVSQDPLYRELMVLKRDIEIYGISQSKSRLADTLWMTGIFLMLNNMVADTPPRNAETKESCSATATT